jgi:Caspase domain
MANRALLIGSQVHGLAGCHADVEVMSALLVERGFEVRSLTEGGATRDAIMAGYQELIDDSAEGDAAVVYYSGHGGRFGNPERSSGQPEWVQYILPSDIDDTTAEDFRGIFAEDLSLLQYQLTQKTRNVTTILDCCHSARMSRDTRIVPKAFSGGWPATAVAKRYQSVTEAMSRARAAAGDDAWSDSNQNAVRLVACAPSESAYEIEDSGIGGTHGALTDAVVLLLRELGSAPATWSLLADRIRRRVAARELPQRPEAEGPTSRLLFDVAERESTGVLPVVIEQGGAFLESAPFFGLEPGDELVLLPAGEAVGRVDPVATAHVTDIVSGRASLDVALRPGLAALPDGVEAHPTRVSLGRQRVVVEGGDAAARQTVEAALADLKHVQLGEGLPRVATVQLTDQQVSLLDALGEPMWLEPSPLDSTGLSRLTRGLTLMARAAHLRALGPGEGDAALTTPVSFRWWTGALEGGSPRELAGEVLHPGDRVFIEVGNDAPAGGPTVYANVFDVGMTSKISLMNSSEPSGIELAPGKRYVFGTNPVEGAPGLKLEWPTTLAARGRRSETIVAIVSDQPQALAQLQTDGVRGGDEGGPASALQQLLASVVTGTREFNTGLGAEPAQPVGYTVARAEFEVEPEPAFVVEDLPDPAQRLARPRSTTLLPPTIAVRLLEVIVRKNRALFKTDVRMDALFVTRPEAADPDRATTAWTERFPTIGDGDRLPLDNLVIYHGPVRDFLDVALWLSRDPSGQPTLDDLVAGATGDQDVQRAVGALAGLAGAGGAAAGMALGAVSVLVRTAGRLLRAMTGDSIGLYRTTLLPLEGFGPGRRPAEGLIEAQEFAFAYEVVPIE